MRLQVLWVIAFAVISITAAIAFRKTLESVAQILSAMGLSHTRDITPDLISRRSAEGVLERMSESYGITPLSSEVFDYESRNYGSGHKNGTVG